MDDNGAGIGARCQEAVVEVEGEACDCALVSLVRRRRFRGLTGSDSMTECL